MPRRRSSLAVGGALLVLAGCGGEPEPLQALPPLAPEDLCALLPAAAIEGLTQQPSSDAGGDPTAACSLNSPGSAEDAVTVLVTWLQVEDDERAGVVLESQCAALPREAGLRQRRVTVAGANETCAGSGTVSGSDRASLALASGREVLTVRVTARGAGQPDSLERATTLAEGLLQELPDPQ